MIRLNMSSRSSLVAQRVQDPAWPLLWLRSLLWHRFTLWPRNFCTPWVRPKKRKCRPMFYYPGIGVEKKSRKKMFLPFSFLHLLPALLSQSIYVPRGCSLVRNELVTGRPVAREGLKGKTLQVGLQMWQWGSGVFLEEGRLEETSRFPVNSGSWPTVGGGGRPMLRSWWRRTQNHLLCSCFWYLREPCSYLLPRIQLELFFFCLFRATPSAYWGSQARGRIGATAAGLCHSHSNARSKLPLQPTPQLMATPDP